MPKSKKTAEDNKDRTENQVAESKTSAKTTAKTKGPKTQPAKQKKEAADKAASAAKAGKRSKKAQEELTAEAKRKDKIEAEKKTPAIKPVARPRDPLARRGKKYRKATGSIDRAQRYELGEAIKLVKASSVTKFDASVDIHVNLGVDPQQSEQVVRTAAILPAGSGKAPRIAVIAGNEKDQKAAKAAGADIVSGEEFIAEIEKGRLDFNLLIATPDVMAKLAKVAKVLGPKGLMPNPKSGTVTGDVAKAAKEARGGRVELRMDKQGIVHQSIGRVSFKESDLAANVKAAIAALQAAKPSTAKGTFIVAITLAATMAPAIRLDVSKVIAEIHR